MAEGTGAHWERLQSAFLERWLGALQGVPAGAAPWDSLTLLGESLTALAAGWSAAGATLPPPRVALRTLLQDLLQRIDLLLEVPAPPPMAPALFPFPMFGPAREWQLAGEQAWRAFVAERVAALALQREDLRALRAGMAGFLAALDASEEAPASLADLHQQLVGHCEEAHQAALASDAYIRAFGAHANAALVLREALLALGERVLPWFGVPTMPDLAALEARLAALEGKATAPSSRVSTSTARKPRKKPAPARAPRTPKAR